jgi:hypothetical protein
MFGVLNCNRVVLDLDMFSCVLLGLVISDINTKH